MKITHALGHNSNWSIESYHEQQIGDYFLIIAFNHGMKFLTKPAFRDIKEISMIDLQFYGKKNNKGKLGEFSFHPANCSSLDVTNVYFDNCIKEAIEFQRGNGFRNIIIPHYYDNEEVDGIISTIKKINNYVKTLQKGNERYFMTLPFANHIIIDKDKVETILFECTDQNICFDGFYIVCENKPEFRRKVTTELKILKNLTKVLKTLKDQNFKTIYSYANWDAVLFLTKTDIDYITIGNYENLRNFDIKRFTEDESGGGSKGYYYSEKLLNMIRADDLTQIRETNNLQLIKNDKNIFSDIIIREGYPWNIHKPEVNKNFFLAYSRLLEDVAGINDLSLRKQFMSEKIEKANQIYDILEQKGVYLDKESSNYHLNIWRTYLNIE